jgi:hypothetical protein
MNFKGSKLAFLSFVVLCGGCISMPEVVHSERKGECKRLVRELVLFSRNSNEIGMYAGSRVIADENIRSFGADVEKLGVVGAGSRVQLYRFFQAANGSAGHFLRVQVEILDGQFAGTVADVPVHAPYHPRKKWTLEYTLDPNALRFNPEVVVPCDS